jgi:oligosaccharide repeat unit polymerase
MSSLSTLESLSLLILWVSALVILHQVLRNFLHPLFLFTLLWVFILVFSIVSGGKYYFSCEALLFLTTAILCLGCGWVIGENNNRQPAPKAKSPNISLLSDGIVFAGGIAGIIAVLLLIEPAFYEASRYGLSGAVSRLSTTLSIERYEGKRLSSAIMACICFSYFTCFVGGNGILHARGALKKIIYTAPLIGLFLFSLIYTSRAVLLFGLFPFISAISISAPEKSSGKTIPIKWIFTAISLAVAGLGLFVVSQSLRMGISLSRVEGLSVVLDHLKVWFAGNISSFCIWYDHTPTLSNHGFGRNTFAGIAEWLGLGQRQLGIYNIAYDVSGKMEFSNIYTLFRFIADDFGWIGSIVLLFSIGITAGFLMRKIQEGNRLATALLTGLLVELNFSFITSIFAYNAVLISWLLFVFFHLFTQTVSENR